ncbi:hypothetical protein SOVF_100520 [Spinacia oleracea]|nr:hypothetical protein SOVF_100520 [Spinacia oleracea]
MGAARITHRAQVIVLVATRWDMLITSCCRECDGTNLSKDETPPIIDTSPTPNNGSLNQRLDDFDKSSLEDAVVKGSRDTHSFRTRQALESLGVISTDQSNPSTVTVAQQSANGEQSHFRILAAVLAFFVTLFGFIRSSTTKVSRRVTTLILNFARSLKEDLQRPSVGVDMTETEFRSITVTRLSGLEEKVNALQTKPMQMPSEKEELLNAAIYQVDALETELMKQN